MSELDWRRKLRGEESKNVVLLQATEYIFCKMMSHMFKNVSIFSLKYQSEN